MQRKRIKPTLFVIGYVLMTLFQLGSSLGHAHAEGHDHRHLHAENAHSHEHWVDQLLEAVHHWAHHHQHDLCLELEDPTLFTHEVVPDPEVDDVEAERVCALDVNGRFQVWLSNRTFGWVQSIEPPPKPQRGPPAIGV